MLADAVSHTMLLGIVLAFLVTQSLQSPLLILGAGLSAWFSVELIMVLAQWKKGYEQAVIGIVFPAFFALAILLIHLLADRVHLDTDIVLVGELAFAPMHRFILNGVDLGVSGIWIGIALLIMNMTWFFIQQRHLRLEAFDSTFALASGVSLTRLNRWQSLVLCITAVGAFDAVGAILVVALMSLPTMTAMLLVNSFWALLVCALAVSSVSVFFGLSIAFAFDISLASCMVLCMGFIFFVVFFLKQLKWL